jgi:hypothetical protein
MTPKYEECILVLKYRRDSYSIRGTANELGLSRFAVAKYWGITKKSNEEMSAKEFEPGGQERARAVRHIKDALKYWWAVKNDPKMRQQPWLVV